MTATLPSPNGSVAHSSRPVSPQDSSVIDIKITTPTDFSELPNSDFSEPPSDNEAQEFSLAAEKIPKYVE